MDMNELVSSGSAIPRSATPRSAAKGGIVSYSVHLVHNTSEGATYKIHFKNTTNVEVKCTLYKQAGMERISVTLPPGADFERLFPGQGKAPTVML